MTMRLGGIASGWDTESIISTMLEAERIPAARLETQNQYLNFKHRAWNELDASFTKLQRTTQSLNSFTTWTQMRADSSDRTALTATTDRFAATGSYAFTNVNMARAHRIAADAQADISSELGYDGNFTIGGKVVEVKSEDSLSKIRDAINAAMVDADADQKVVASIIDTTLVIERRATGSGQINISDDSSGILLGLGIVTDSPELTVANELQAGRSFSALVNGVAIERQSNTGITDVIAGVTLNFRSEDDSTLDVDRDTDTIRSLIDSFISQYNETMALAADYSKVEMTDTSASLANAEVDSVGILQGNLLLSQLQSRSRALITTQDNSGGLDPMFNTLSTIGIWTNGRDNKLEIVNEEALNNALTNNFEKVDDLFRSYQGGVLRNLNTYLTSVVNPIDGSIVSSKKSLETTIKRNEKDIDRIDNRLADMETMLWEKFARMEQAMAQSSSQTGMIMAMLTAKK